MSKSNHTRGQLNENLRALHRRGLKDPRTHDLDALLVVARSLSSHGTDAERIQDSLEQAIDGYVQPHKNVVRLWFGLSAVDDPDAPDTREMSSRERHKVAWEYSGKKVAESSFRTHDAEKHYKYLSRRLADLSAQAAVLLQKSVTAHQDRPLTRPISSASDLADDIAHQTFVFLDSLVSPSVRLLSSQMESTCDWLYDALLGYLVDVLGKLIVEGLNHSKTGTAKLEPRREGAHATRIIFNDAAYVIAVGTRPARPYEVDVTISDVSNAAVAAPQQLILSNEGRLVLASLRAPNRMIVGVVGGR